MIGDRADGQCLGTVLCGHAVDTGGFHLDTQDAVFFHDVEHGGVRGIEQVGGEDVTHAHWSALVLGGLHGIGNQIEVGDGGEVVILEAQTVDLGVGAGTHADHHVTQFDVFTHGTAGAHADQGLHAVVGDQLFGIDGAGRDAHAVAHDGDATALVGTGEAEHAAHVTHLLDVLQEGLGDVLGTQGVARHQHCVSKGAIFCIDMRSCHSLDSFTLG
ncbi:hypothetical protein D3C87_926450 [compost metagenome]